MEEGHESRVLCKLCDKSCPNGKALEGHMRSHVMISSNSAESPEKFEHTMEKLSSSNGNSIYGLRENPKRTWRAKDFNLPLPQERACKLCGKGFLSLKALCGHMACHSERDRSSKAYDYSWRPNEDPKAVMDSYSDTEARDPARKTRSKRYKRVVAKSSSLSFAHCNSNHAFSSVSEIDKQEQEEVAMCLMMLSKDSGNWVGVNSVVESSDNNSAVLETKSSSNDMRIGRKKKNYTLAEHDRSAQMTKPRLYQNSEIHPLDKSNSGYVRNGKRKFGAEISADESVRNGDCRARVAFFDEKLGEGVDRGNCFRENGLKGNFTKERRCDRGITGDDSNTGREFGEAMHKKRSNYECLNCHKIFSSFQGLGGHRPCHKMAKDISPRHESINDRTTAFGARKLRAGHYSFVPKKSPRSKKNKTHDCTYCPKIFKSGQALGGHKRSHFINGSEERVHRRRTEKEVSGIHSLIDLNLPAPEED